MTADTPDLPALTQPGAPTQPGALTANSADRSPSARFWGILHFLGVKVLLPLAVFVCVGWVALLAVVTLFTVVPENDFGRFYCSALAFVRGEDMYTWWPATPATWKYWMMLEGETFYLDLYNMNPPHFHLLLLPLVPLGPEWAMAVWLLLGLGCLGLTLHLANRAGQIQWSEVAKGLLMLLLCGEMGQSMAKLGQVSLLLALMVTLVWWHERRGEWTAAGIWLGLGIAFKSFLLVLVPYFVLTRRWRLLGVALLSALASFALGVLVFGLDNHRTWLAGVGSSDAWVWWPNNASLMAALARTFSENAMFEAVTALPMSTVKLLWVLLGGLMGLATLVVAIRGRNALRTDRAHALLLTGCVLFSPLGWNYYFWLPLAPLLVVLVGWLCETPQEGPAPGVRQARWTLLIVAALAYSVPLAFITTFQPASWATCLIGNAYFWAAFLVWLALLLDGWNGKLPQTAILSTSGDRL